MAMSSSSWNVLTPPVGNSGPVPLGGAQAL